MCVCLIFLGMYFVDFFGCFSKTNVEVLSMMPLGGFVFVQFWAWTRGAGSTGVICTLTLDLMLLCWVLSMLCSRARCSKGRCHYPLDKSLYFISQIVRALWLVNFVNLTVLPAKFKTLFLHAWFLDKEL